MFLERGEVGRAREVEVKERRKIFLTIYPRDGNSLQLLALIAQVFHRLGWQIFQHYGWCNGRDWGSALLIYERGIRVISSLFKLPETRVLNAPTIRLDMIHRKDMGNIHLHFLGELRTRHELVLIYTFSQAHNRRRRQRDIITETSSRS